jgi:hypothetical protein
MPLLFLISGMAAQGSGSIITIGSMAGQPSDPGATAGTAPDPGRHSFRHVSPRPVRARPSGRPHSQRPFVKGNTDMSNSLLAIAIDCTDAPAVARFWAEVLGRQVAEDSTSQHVILLPGDGDTDGPRITPGPRGSLPGRR